MGDSELMMKFKINLKKKIFFEVKNLKKNDEEWILNVID